MLPRKPFWPLLSLGIMSWLSLSIGLIPAGTNAASAHAAPGHQLAPAWPPCAVIDGQVMLMGARSDIQALVTLLPNLTLLQQSDMSWMQQVSLAQIAPLTAAVNLSELEVQLYTITDGTSVEDMITTILPATAGHDLVIAAPNCRTFGHGHSAKGSPFAITITSQPLDMRSPQSLTQPAFGPFPAGIGLYDGANRKTDATGKGVTIAVFDTSPFPVPDGDRSGFAVPDAGGSTRDRDTATRAFQVQVFHPVMPIMASLATEKDNVINHGLIAAGVVYGVAPESDLHLYRVLDETGEGDTYTLIASVSAFVKDKLTRDRTIRCTVMNMGLGLGEDADLPAEANPLYTTLNAVAGLGGVVVASVGNDSTRTTMRPAQEPARYPSVIGVAATNRRGERSCFSNTGEVAAPGGDGLDSDHGECDLPSDTDYVVGPALPLAAGSVTSGSNTIDSVVMAQAAGTSFAAPAITGLTALLLEEQHCQMTAENVRTVIERGGIGTSDSTVPIVNVPRTMPNNTLSLPLQPGWQQVGLPLLPDNTPIAMALASIEGAYDAACTYDPTSRNSWRCYLAAVDGGALTAVGPTTGLWVHITKPTILKLKGNYPLTAGYTFDAGWNLVSFALPIQQPVDTFLAPLAGKVEAVYTYTDSGWLTYIPGAATQSLPMIEPGKAYWVKMAGKSTFTAPNP